MSADHDHHAPLTGPLASRRTGPAAEVRPSDVEMLVLGPAGARHPWRSAR